MFSSAQLTALWYVAGWTMAHFLWIGAVLFLLAAAVRMTLRRAPPNARYAAMLGFLTLLAATPVVIALTLPAARLLPSSRAAAVAANGISNVEQGISNDEVGGVDSVAARDAFAESVTPDNRHAESSHHAPRDVAGSAEALPRDQLRLAERDGYMIRLVRYLPALWLVGTPLTLLWLATGLVGTKRLNLASRPVASGPLTEALERTKQTLRVSRRIGLAVCDRLAAPILIGVVRPLVLLPPTALTGWSPEELEMVLLHELAHVRRWDNLINLLQRLVEASFFFHPAVWIISNWGRREREHCCDTVVLRHTESAPREYARTLLAIAEAARRPATRPLAASGSLASHTAAGRLKQRIAHILKAEDEPMRVSLKTMTGVVAAVAVVCVATWLGLAKAESGADQRPGRSERPGRSDEISNVEQGISNDEVGDGDAESTGERESESPSDDPSSDAEDPPSSSIETTDDGDAMTAERSVDWAFDQFEKKLGIRLGREPHQLQHGSHHLTGLDVLSVRSPSPAESARITEGDVIYQIHRWKINDPQSLARAVQQIVEGKTTAKPMVSLIRRIGESKSRGIGLAGFDVTALINGTAREDLRYDNKTFDEWRSEWRTELKTERRAEAIRALAAFGARGYGKEAAEAILNVVREYDWDGSWWNSESTLSALKLSATYAFIGGSFRTPGKESPKMFVDGIPIDDWLPLLVDAVRAGDQRVLQFSRRVFTDLGPSHAVAAQQLLELSRDETFKDVEYEILDGLVGASRDTRDERIVQRFREALKHDDERIVRIALEVTFPANYYLAEGRSRELPERMFDYEYVPELLDTLKHENTEVHKRALAVFRHLGPKAAPAVPRLVEMLASDEPKHVQDALEILQSIGPEARAATDAVLGIAQDEQNELRRGALSTLMAIDRPEPKVTIPLVIEMLRSVTETAAGARSRYAEIWATYLGDCGPAAKGAVPVLLPLLVPEGGAKVVGGMKQDGSPLILLRDSPKAAAAALHKITGSNDAAIEYLEMIIASGASPERQVVAAKAKRVLKALKTSGKDAFMETKGGGGSGWQNR